MPELIEKIEALGKLQSMYIQIEYACGYGNPVAKGIRKAYKAIERMPAIKPEERRGRWIVNDRNPDYADCTNCGLSEWLGANGSRKYAKTLLSGFKKFCPNCGARMDLRTPTEVQLDEADSVMMGDANNG